MALLVVSLTACSGSDPDPPNSVAQPVDLLYTNAVVWTGVDGAADASVIAINNGRIVYVGDGLDAALAPRQVVDLGGSFVMPGFIDNHVHFIEGGAALAGVQLRDAATPQQFAQRIAAFAATRAPDAWVLFGNWDHEQWGGELPHRKWIDATTPATPVFVVRLDGHMALANSAALDLAGVDAHTRTPAGGEIVRDPDGTPTGILKDNAMALVSKFIPAPNIESRLAAFSAAQSHALSLGLVQVHAVTANASETWIADLLRTARRRDQMTIRVYALSPLEHWQRAAQRMATQGDSDDVLRWGGLKGFVDGSLGSTTAWFYEPYTDQPDASGFALTPPDTLADRISSADAAGLRLAVHAIGDRAIDVLLDTFEATAGADITQRRYRIEHFQHPGVAAIQRAAQLGVIASAQPYHAIDDGRWAEQRIGPQRVKTTYPFRSILDAGGRLTFGSDWPVAPLSPLLGVYAAVTRRTTDGAHPDGWQPQQKITVVEALRAYTVSNAYAGFEEDVAGTLVPGKRADLVILAQDPRAVAAKEIPDIEIVATIIDGKTVFGSTP